MLMPVLTTVFILLACWLVWVFTVSEWLYAWGNVLLGVHMTKNNSNVIKLKPSGNLCQTTVIRRRGRFRYADFSTALESIRPWVGFCEAIRIFEQTVGL